jgi:hypothetical protein
MYQSSNRNSFLDSLLDPTAIAILGSIALHATLGASLPFFAQPEKEAKKAGPGTVKVIQLSPSELQRIPQAPPIPIPQPISPTIIPSSQATPPPSTPQFTTGSATIPFSPIRIPLEKITPKPLPAKKKLKEQKAIPQQQPAAPIFDPNISFKPSPQPSPKPITKKTQTVTSPTPQQVPGTDNDGDDQQPTDLSPTPNSQAQKPSQTPPPANSPQPTPSTQPQNNSTGGDNGGDFYGDHIQSATERLKKYLTDYPDIKLYPHKVLTKSYPSGVICRQVKQPPFIVLMVAFGKVPENTENNILGETSAPSIDKPYVAGDRDTPENQKLAEIAATAAFYDANKSDQNRLEADKGKRVLYQYRVQFDPESCKN